LPAPTTPPPTRSTATACGRPPTTSSAPRPAGRWVWNPLPPIPVTVAALVEDIAARLRSAGWLRDRHGLADVRADSGALSLTFTTGHTALIRFALADPDTTS
jgi:hypothetical protein